MTADDTPPAGTVASAAPPLWLRIALVIVAAIETLNALSDFPGIFYEWNHTEPLVIFAQRLTTAKIALAPLFAGAALVYASIARVRYAIAALAVLALLRWLVEIPSLFIHGLELSATGPGLFMFAWWFIYPLIGVTALALAYRNRRLVLAGALVSLPTLAGIAMVVIFAIGVMIYGF